MRGTKRADWRGIALLAAVVCALVLPAAIPSPATAASPASSAAPAIWLGTTNGGIYAVGSAHFKGSLAGTKLSSIVIAISARPTGNGYWEARFDGTVTRFGDAHHYGDAHTYRLQKPIVGMTSTPDGLGYWLLGADGGVFGYGDARFYGSLGGAHLNKPIASIVSSKTGHGYWLVAADGGVFGYGDAKFYGSLGSAHITTPVGAIAAARDGKGYWLLTRAGQVFKFGSAGFFGNATSTPGLAVGLVPTADGTGYWIAFADGTIRAFGHATGVARPAGINAPVDGLATPWAASAGLALPLLEALGGIPKPAPAQLWVNRGQVALTFDDGPGADTPAVLAALKRFGVPATFFTVGYEVTARPDLVRAEVAAGMSVENHTWDHHDLTRLSDAEIATELQRDTNAVRSATGHAPSCFRPPYGATNPRVIADAAKLGLHQILWNVDPSDYLRPGTNAIVQRVLSQATGRGLVVGIHDGGGPRGETVAALPAIIVGLRARGYSFVKLCT